MFTQVLNARHLTSEELIRFDTGRKRHRAVVREALLDSSHNVYLYGSRGSGKTFFQKTQTYYFKELDPQVLTLFIPCDMRWRGEPNSSTDFALHVLSTLCLEWWQRAYKRPKSDLLRLAITGQRSALDGLHRDQQRFVQLYSIIHASHVTVERRRISLLGATAVVKAENRRDEGEVVSRGALLPSEVSALVSELADVMSQAKIRRVVVQLDEVEIVGMNRAEDFYIACLELFNPVGVQFLVTGTPTGHGTQESLVSNFETNLELEGLDDVTELVSMVAKYSEGGRCTLPAAAISVLFEFFSGHPRSSLGACFDAIGLAAGDQASVTPGIMTKACLAIDRHFQEVKASYAMFRAREDAGR